MNRLISSLMLGGGVLAAPSVVLAQASSSLIRGTVMDQSGMPMKGVRVVASSPTQIGGAKTAYSDDEGNFRIVGLLPGDFEVTATSPGLKTVVQKAELSVNAPLDLTFVMEVKTETETVTVVERPPTVSTTAANVKETFSQKFIEEVPLTTRSYQNVADQAVGWNATGNNFRVRGGNVYDNNFMMDGFQLQDPVNRQTAQFVNFDAISAIEVQSAAYGAENATAQGGVMNVVTKSGSNEYKFELSSTYTDQNLQFWTDQNDARSPTRNAYLNASVGGPIVKDRLWFFVSNETQSQVTNLGKDPSGLVQGEHPSKDYLALRFVGKLTWQMSARNKLSLLGLFTPERTENAVQRFQTDPTAERFDKFSSRFVGLTWQAAITDSLLFRLQGGFNEITREQRPQSCESDPACLARPSVRDVATNVTFGNFNKVEESVGRNYQINSDLEWFKDRFLGDHRAKIGFRLNFNENPFRLRVPGDRTEQWADLSQNIRDRRTVFCANDPSIDGQPCRPGWFESSVSGENHIAFVQDAWRPTSHLTVTPGVAVNYGNQRDENGRSVIKVVAPTPHLSAVWDPTHDGKTALRGSVASYVDTGFLQLARFGGRSQFGTECRWDEMTQDFTGSCRNLGGVGRSTIGKPCGPTGLDADGTPCKIGHETPRTWEFTVGAEREVVPTLAVGTDFIYRRYTNQWEDAETNRLWNEGGTALRSDGGFKNNRNETIFDLSARPENNRTYRGITVFMRKYEGNFQALVAWTRHSQYGSPLGFDSDFLSNPQQAMYQRGYIATDQRNEAKFMGNYRFASWLTIGTNIVYRNGPPWNRYYYNSVTGGFNDLRGEVGTDPRNVNDADDDQPLREPDAFLVYAQARVRWKPLIAQDLETWVDVFNIAGNREVTGFVEQDGPTWGQPRSRRAPPYFRLGLRYRY